MTLNSKIHKNKHMPCKTTSTNLTLHKLQSPSTPLTPLYPSSSKRHNFLIKSTLLNTCSIRNKIPLILDLAEVHYLDIIFITETWIMPDEIPLISSPNNGRYSFSHLTIRNIHIYGGVLVLSINPPFMYPLYVTIIMINLRCLPVPLDPHTPRLLIYHFFPTPLFLNPFIPL